MNTLNKLQAMLATPTKNLNGYAYKENTPVITCADGVTASIQASENHYCEPRENYGPYSEVEVWCINGTDTTNITQFDYSVSDPSGYVPITAVVAFLDAHGGIAN